MHTTDVTLALADDGATIALGNLLAPLMERGLVIWLNGDLGAGKTSLVRALLRARGETGPVKSPTYTLVEVHLVSGIYFYHFDFYRFNQAEEYLDAGLDEYFSGDGICLVEWPEKAQPYLAPPDLQIELRVDGDGRIAHLHSRTTRGHSCLSKLAAANCLNSPPPA